MTDSSLDKFVARGTSTARAAFTPSPPLSSSGYFWFETDTNDTYAWSGSAWVKVNSSSGGSAPYSSTTTSGSQSNVTVSGIPGTSRNMKIVINGRGDTAATTTQLKVQLNSDTAANYDVQYVLGIGASASASATYAGSFGILADLVAASGTSGRSTSLTAEIPHYAGSTFQKTIFATCGAGWGTSGGAMEAGVFTTVWRSTAAITAVKIFPSAGNFADGTTVDIYLY